MPLVQPSPVIKYQFFDANGDPLAFGLVYAYQAGTTTPLDTYVDHNGVTKNTNPIQLDAGGYADIWLTASSYKISVHDANDVPLYTIDGIPGLGSIITVGDLPPLFTSLLSGGALNFTLSNAGPRLLFGRFAGTTGAPSYGAIGNTTEITTNQGGLMLGDSDFTWDAATSTFSVKDAGSAYVRLIAGSPGGRIIFGTGSSPYIRDVTDFEFASPTDSDFRFGFFGSETAVFKLCAPTGAAGFPLGNAMLGVSDAEGILRLNDGTSAAGVFLGPLIMAGNGDPENVFTARIGSIYMRADGGAGTSVYIKQSTTGNTGWVAVTP